MAEQQLPQSAVLLYPLRHPLRHPLRPVTE
jgi:hypothetical protein